MGQTRHPPCVETAAELLLLQTIGCCACLDRDLLRCKLIVGLERPVPAFPGVRREPAAREWQSCLAPGTMQALDAVGAEHRWTGHCIIMIWTGRTTRRNCSPGPCYAQLPPKRVASRIINIQVNSSALLNDRLRIRQVPVMRLLPFLHISTPANQTMDHAG